MNKDRIIKDFAFILLSGFVFLAAQWFSENFSDGSLQAFDVTEPKVVSQPALQQDSLPSTDSQIENQEIKAKSALAVEIGSGAKKILFQKNEGKKLPIASLAKLMSTLVVLEEYDLEEEVVVSETAMTQEGEQGDLKLGEVLSVKDLLYIMLMESSNRAAYTLSEVIGTDLFAYLMNEYAQKLGLLNTHFEDSTGLSPKSYSTSEDLVILSQYLFENYSLFREITSLKEFDLYLEDGQLHHKLINTNKFLGEIEGVIGGKTGWTNVARGCFILIQKNSENKNYLIYVILGSEDRFLEMKKLIELVNIT